MVIRDFYKRNKTQFKHMDKALLLMNRATKALIVLNDHDKKTEDMDMSGLEDVIENCQDVLTKRGEKMVARLTRAEKLLYDECKSVAKHGTPSP
jgi:hypothetical protein